MVLVSYRGHPFASSVSPKVEQVYGMRLSKSRRRREIPGRHASGGVHVA